MDKLYLGEFSAIPRVTFLTIVRLSDPQSATLSWKSQPSPGVVKVHVALK